MSSSADNYFEQYFADKGEFKNLDLTLVRIQQALDEASFDEAHLGRIVHIAGTNGKGSTAFILSQMLRAAGFSVCLFTSPHIETVHERIKHNFEDISHEEFNSLFIKHKHLIEKHNLSYFEALTLIAFIYFADLRPDFTIVETGLGGRYDSTNVLENKTCIITQIAMDHEAFLGNDIFSIAREKLAIIKNNIPAFIGENTSQVTSFINDELDGAAVFAESFPDINSPFHAPYNKNHKLAHIVYRFLTGRDDAPDALMLPQCRMERFGRFILDGSHNEAGLSEVASSASFDCAVISSTADRDINRLIPLLEQHTDRIIVTEIPDCDRSIDTASLNTRHKTVKNADEALKLAVELAPDADILVCGSLYLCAFVRKLLTNKDIIS